MAFERNKFSIGEATRVNLEKFLVSHTAAVTEDFLRNHTDGALRQTVVEEMMNPLMRGYLVTLRTFLLKSKQAEKRTFSIQVPATWWDHLKHDWLNAGGFRRWFAEGFAKPEYRTESKEFEVSIRLCPHNNSYLQGDPEVHFDFLTWKDQKTGIYE
jgi:hypothetical protein